MHPFVKFDPDFKITLAVDPVAKARPRVCKNGMTYTPQKTRRAEDSIRWLISQELESRTVPLYEGPLYVELEFQFARPKSVKRQYHTVKPDLDNLKKLVGDAGNGLLWRDDSQICQLKAQKYYGDRGAIKMWVWRLDVD